MKHIFIRDSWAAKRSPNWVVVVSALLRIVDSIIMIAGLGFIGSTFGIDFTMDYVLGKATRKAKGAK